MSPMRIIFALPVSLGLAFCAQPSEYPDCGPRTLVTYDLLGPVRSVRVEEAGTDGKRELIAKTVFDRAGRLSDDRRQTTVGDSPEHPGYQVFRYIYEPQGRNYEIDMFDVDPAQGEKPIDLQHHFVKFDSLSHCIEERDIDGDGEFHGKSTYEYDGRGDFTREIDYKWDGKISAQEDKTYSADHKLLSEKTIEDRGQGLTYRWSREHQYDARGTETDMFSYQQGVLEAHWIFKYDERNRRISSQTIVADPQKDPQAYGRCFDCGLSSGETTYKYDDANRVREERMFQPGNKLINVHLYPYDEHGSRLASPDSIYSYDSQGNWVKEVSSTYTLYRTIDYY